MSVKLRILAGIILSLFISALVGCTSLLSAGKPSAGVVKTAAKNGPVVSGLQPAVTAAGAPQVVVSVMGDNFDGKAVVLWNKTPRATRLISATQLQVSLTSTDVAVPGTTAVAVSNTANGVTSNSTTFTVVQGGPAIATTSLPAASSGVLYSTTLAATGGTSPYKWSATGLPAGLVVSSTGSILGTPTTAGTFPVGLHLSDSTGASADQATALTVNSAPTASRNLLSITTTSLPSGTEGSAYSATLTVSGGTAPYSWSAESLPAGLTFSSGAISGTPSASGTFSVGFIVTDSTGASATTNLVISIVTATLLLQITTATLPQGTLDTQYSATLSAIGGSPSYTWSIDSGSLPPSLVLDPTNGTIAGTLSVAGEFPFDVQVKDATQKTASKSLVVSVSPSTQTQCLPPNYCADTSTGLKPYPSPALSGGNNPPVLNTAFTDPVFNRKIWRVTDSTTSPASIRAGDPFGIPFQSFYFADAWNKNDTVFLAGAAWGAMFLRCDLSNPNAPSCPRWTCSSGPLCRAGYVVEQPTFSVPTWAHTSNYDVYGLNPSNNSLYKATLDYSNTTTDPTSGTLAKVYSPNDTGQCLDGRTFSGGAFYTVLSIDDQFSYGYHPPAATSISLVLHKQGKGCVYIDEGVAGWRISGDSSIFGNTLPAILRWTDAYGNSGPPAPGTGCGTQHGIAFDSVSKTVLIDQGAGNIPLSACFGSAFSGIDGVVAAGSTSSNINATGLSVASNFSNGDRMRYTSGALSGCAQHILTYTHGSPSAIVVDGISCGTPSVGDHFTFDPDDSTIIIVNLVTMTAARINQPNSIGTGGHGMGFANVGGAVADLVSVGGNFVLGASRGTLWNPLLNPVGPPPVRWTQPLVGGSTQDVHGSNSDYSAGRSMLPIVGVLSSTEPFDASGKTPPLSSYTVTAAYNNEIDIAVMGSLSDSSQATIYRIVHNYSVRDDAGLYSSQAHPAISHNRCWVAWSSNWLGNLGTAYTDPPTTCTNFNNCRTDLFLTYLCN